MPKAKKQGQSIVKIKTAVSLAAITVQAVSIVAGIVLLTTFYVMAGLAVTQMPALTRLALF